jgi:putative sigma-54 modulation protein
MIAKLDISGVHMEVDKKLNEYVVKKIGKLDKYMPRHARDSAHAEVFLKEAKTKQGKQCIAEVTIRLPKGNVTAEESTMNIYAAVDIVEAKLKNQIKKYKETHGSLRIHRRVLNRVRRSAA